MQVDKGRCRLRKVEDMPRTVALTEKAAVDQELLAVLQPSRAGEGMVRGAFACCTARGGRCTANKAPSGYAGTSTECSGPLALPPYFRYMGGGFITMGLIVKYMYQY